MVRHGGEIVFHAPRIADSPFWVVNETEESGALLASLVTVRVHSNLLGNVLCRKTCACFLYDDRKAIVIEQKRCPGFAVGITGVPFVSADVFELDPKKGVKEVLHVDLVFD